MQFVIHKRCPETKAHSGIYLAVGYVYISLTFATLKGRLSTQNPECAQQSGLTLEAYFYPNVLHE